MLCFKEYHISLKQSTSISNSHTKTADIQSRHFVACMLAFLKLEALNSNSVWPLLTPARLYLTGLNAIHLKLSKLAA